MIEDTIKERTESYGDFTDNATVAQLLKDAIQMETNYPNMPPYMRESLDIICSKISRMVTGDWKHADNWLDIQGFAKLSLDRLNETRHKTNEDYLFAKPMSFEKWCEYEGWEEVWDGLWEKTLSDLCYTSERVPELHKKYLNSFTNNDGKSTKVDES